MVLMAQSGQITAVNFGPQRLEALLGKPKDATGLVIFAHGSGSGRLSPRNNEVADGLRQAGLATLLLDLLTPEEEQNRANVFDIPLLASRLIAAIDWAQAESELEALRIGLFGASTGACYERAAFLGWGTRGQNSNSNKEAKGWHIDPTVSLQRFSWRSPFWLPLRV